MAEENSERDLFGDSVLPRREGPGRPEAVWNRQTSDRVLLAFVVGRTVKQAADLAGLSTPTFRKVYFSECAKRKAARDRHEFRQLALLAGQAEAGNVGASKELHRRLEALRAQDLAERIASPAKPKAPLLGKKERRKLAARHAGSGDRDWGDLIGTAPPDGHG